MEEYMSICVHLVFCKQAMRHALANVSKIFMQKVPICGRMHVV